MNNKSILSHSAYLFVAVMCMVLDITSTATAAPLTADSLASRLMYQVWSFPQEKVYVMTDRDAYTSGDTVRFRAWLVDAATHARPQQPSRFVYVELRNPFGNVEKRVKIRSEEGKFAGIIALDEEMAEGTYTLCSYTQFMQNSGEDYFFRKNLPIFSLLSSKYQLETTFGNDYLTARLLEINSGREVRAEKISVLGPDSIYYADKIRKRSSYTMNVSAKMRSAGKAKVKFDRYEKFITIPYDTMAISLTFHPEGGYMIAEESNRLAFKGIDVKGLSAEFKGIIIDDLGEIAGTIESDHKGMGMTEFTPRAGRAYKAVVDSMSFTLPTAESEVAVLRVSPEGSDSIRVDIRGKFENGLSVIVHNGGIVSHSIDMRKPTIMIDRHELGSGIVQLLLIDSGGTTLSSRMIFNHSGYLYDAPFDSIPEGDYSIRAFHNIEPDSTSSIVSNFLLQSELKGHIEDPDYYFRNRNSNTDYHLDLLMLTQGWERYDLRSAFKGIYSDAEIPLEIGGEITGSVKSRWRGKPLEGAIVMVLAPKMEYAAQAITDNDGRFIIDGFDWPEDTSFIVRVLSESGDKEHNYTVDSDQFPSIESIFTKDDEVISKNAIEEQLLASGTVMLDELEVTAPLSPEESHREMMNALGVKSVTSDEIDKMHATTYEEVIRKIPGLRIIEGNVRSPRTSGTYNKGSYGSGVEFWVDGSRWYSMGSSSSGSLSTSLATSPNAVGGGMLPEHTYRVSTYSTLSEFASMYPLHIIKSIEYYPPVLSVIISNTAAYGGGALVFTTKDASDVKEWDSTLFIKEFKPLGYQDKKESYSPHFIYDLTSSESLFNAAWLPIVESHKEIPHQEDTFIEIEGISNGFMPIVTRYKFSEQ